jgi:hypothetical protein
VPDTATAASSPPVQPQSITVGNAHATVEFVTVAVEHAGETVFVESREVVPGERRSFGDVSVPRGTYRVAVETDAGRVAGDWHVPQEPARVVDVSTLDVGCGPANTELRLRNADDRHTPCRSASTATGRCACESSTPSTQASVVSSSRCRTRGGTRCVSASTEGTRRGERGGPVHRTARRRSRSTPGER